MMAVIGLPVLIAGLFFLSSATVSCGGDTMAADDKCFELVDGKAQAKSYDEIKAADERTALIIVGAGVVFLAIAAGYVLLGRKGKRQVAASAASAAAFMDS